MNQVKFELYDNEKLGELSCEHVHNSISQPINLEELKKLVKELENVVNQVCAVIMSIDLQIKLKECTYKLKKLIGVD